MPRKKKPEYKRKTTQNQHLSGQQVVEQKKIQSFEALCRIYTEIKDIVDLLSTLSASSLTYPWFQKSYLKYTQLRGVAKEKLVTETERLHLDAQIADYHIGLCILGWKFIKENPPGHFEDDLRHSIKVLVNSVAFIDKFSHDPSSKETYEQLTEFFSSVKKRWLLSNLSRLLDILLERKLPDSITDVFKLSSKFFSDIYSELDFKFIASIIYKYRTVYSQFSYLLINKSTEQEMHYGFLLNQTMLDLLSVIQPDSFVEKTGFKQSLEKADIIKDFPNLINNLLNAIITMYTDNPQWIGSEGNQRLLTLVSDYIDSVICKHIKSLEIAPDDNELVPTVYHKIWQIYNAEANSLLSNYLQWVWFTIEYIAFVLEQCRAIMTCSMLLIYQKGAASINLDQLNQYHDVCFTLFDKYPCFFTIQQHADRPVLLDELREFARVNDKDRKKNIEKYVITRVKRIANLFLIATSEDRINGLPYLYAFESFAYEIENSKLIANIHYAFARYWYAKFLDSIERNAPVINLIYEFDQVIDWLCWWMEHINPEKYHERRVIYSAFVGAFKEYQRYFLLVQCELEDSWVTEKLQGIKNNIDYYQDLLDSTNDTISLLNQQRTGLSRELELGGELLPKNSEQITENESADKKADTTDDGEYLIYIKAAKEMTEQSEKLRKYNLALFEARKANRLDYQIDILKEIIHLKTAGLKKIIHPSEKMFLIKNTIKLIRQLLSLVMKQLEAEQKGKMNESEQTILKNAFEKFSATKLELESQNDRLKRCLKKLIKDAEQKKALAIKEGRYKIGGIASPRKMNPLTEKYLANRYLLKKLESFDRQFQDVKQHSEQWVAWINKTDRSKNAIDNALPEIRHVLGKPGTSKADKYTKENTNSSGSAVSSTGQSIETLIPISLFGDGTSSSNCSSDDTSANSINLMNG